MKTPNIELPNNGSRCVVPLSFFSSFFLEHRFGLYGVQVALKCCYGWLRLISWKKSRKKASGTFRSFSAKNKLLFCAFHLKLIFLAKMGEILTNVKFYQ